jgi:hypothetical protein
MRVRRVEPGAVSAAWFLIDTETGQVSVGVVPTVVRMVNAAGWTALMLEFLPNVAVIETVGAMLGQGMTSMFRRGVGAGTLHSLMAGGGSPIFEVLWDKAIYGR